jgi:hypothetical protein
MNIIRQASERKTADLRGQNTALLGDARSAMDAMRSYLKDVPFPEDGAAYDFTVLQLP